MKDASIGAITYQSDQGYAQLKYFKHFALIAKQHQIPFFVFSVNDVDVEQKRIHGLWYNEVTNQWVRKTFPFPTIVYDHVRFHPTPQFRRYVSLRQSGLMKFSYNGYANKYIVMEYLSSFKDLEPYIPKTIKVDDINQVISFIQQHSSILKPYNGSGGRDVYKIEKAKQNIIVRGQSIGQKTLTIEEFKDWLQKRSSKERYLLQKYIPIQYDGHTCDTRVLLQKDGTGRWTFTGMGTRIGRQQSVASNLAKGATAIRTEQFIEKYLRLQPEPIIEEIKRVCLMIAKRLEEHFGNFVEFGMDIGITPDGTFQLIEANSKPDRKILLKTKQYEALEQAIRKPFEYHLFLCNQLQNKKVSI